MSAETLTKKSRDVSYAVIWVSRYVKRLDLRQRLEYRAVELVESVAGVGLNPDLMNVNGALTTIVMTDNLIRLAHAIYEIEPVNAAILLKELDGLNAAIRQYGNLESAMPNLAKFFNDHNDKEFVTVQMSPMEKSEEKSSHSSDYSNGGSNGFGVNAAIRQSAIINRIKSISSDNQGTNEGGCRLKDLLVEFPDVSERTLRYDLQRLCDQGLVERVGNGGPSSYYRVKS